MNPRMTAIPASRFRLGFSPSYVPGDEAEVPPGGEAECWIRPQMFVVLHQIVLRGWMHLVRLRIGAALDVPFELVNEDGELRQYRLKDLDQAPIKDQLVATGAPAVNAHTIAIPPGLEVYLELRNERGISTKPHAALLVQEETT